MDTTCYDETTILPYCSIKAEVLLRFLAHRLSSLVLLVSRLEILDALLPHPFVANGTTVFSTCKSKGTAIYAVVAGPLYTRDGV